MKGFEYVFQNYVYVPVLSAIIGGLLALGVPKLFSLIGRFVKKRISKSVDVMDIAGEWNSFFHEEDTVRSETVKLEQSGQCITGTILLDKTQYRFEGEFKNNILTGTYRSKNTKKYESGSITVRRINEDLMSGYCTFVYKDKQVYNSPYVLSSTNSHKVNKGTFPFCNTCVGKFDCCCNCNAIDMPILLPFEAKKIALISRESIEKFAQKLTTNLYQMKRENGDSNGCFFFKNNKCTIYDCRPIDCRLFPFDFKEIEGTYWLIYYNDVAVCRALPTEKKDIDCCAHNIRPLLDIMLPYMSECTSPVFSERLKKQSFVQLFPLDRIRDDNLN